MVPTGRDGYVEEGVQVLKGTGKFRVEILTSPEIALHN
jgi:hypothetical protein